MKRWIAALSAIVLLFALCACGNTQPQTEPSVSATEAPSEGRISEKDSYFVHIPENWCKMEYTDKGLTAPINKGDVVATVEVWYRNTCLHEAELYAMSDVRAASNSGMEVLGGADRRDAESRLSRIVLIVCVSILAAVGGYLAINYILRVRRRAKTRRRRNKNRRRSD